ncbi:MAG: FMN-binding protein [Bacilli bacterium]|nr:FMN-binding protein [Bacilli bacterium]
MKKGIFIVFGVLVVLVVGMILMVNYMENNLDVMLAEELLPIDPSTEADGTYTGVYDAKLIHVEVLVTIRDGEISSIEILKHDNGQGDAAEAIVDYVIESQSIDVDAIAGATYSSRVILLAISDALNS